MKRENKIESIVSDLDMNSLDASEQLCQYEIPGRGVCHNKEYINVYFYCMLEEVKGNKFDISGILS